ncbi:MAG TPA: limonene-1,2-epoxide hydrolase family protein [Pseudonocardia sp.]|jgi:limonene-1,2-epoxide hydrolase|nr:limonene-1,2-epoxide hydrolase family protein [Pseudonocardia sp.]
MTNAQEVVEKFLGSLGPTYDDMLKSVTDQTTDDFVWQNSGLPTCNGQAEAISFLEQFAKSFSMASIKIDIVAIGSAGNVVVTERVDHFVDANGQVLASLALAGTLEVRDGKISAWRDYFDPRPLLSE